MTRSSLLTAVLLAFWTLQLSITVSPAHADHIRDLQTQAAESGRASWGHWGSDPTRYSTWTSHTNRLVPVYTFGIGLDAVRGKNSAYRSPERLEQLYGRVPDGTLNLEAEYFDQTDVYRVQRIAVEQGKKRIILVVFDGMDWSTTWLAATHRTGRVSYRDGRGSGLFFQDYTGAPTDYGFCVTSPHNEGTRADVNAQTLLNPGGTRFGGYAYRVAGETPWAKPIDLLYPVGKGSDYSHVYADSASSATSMTSGIKTYNGAINVNSSGQQTEPIARYLQGQGFAVGVVTSVPVSHATPAAAYASNVNRNDYQDLARDMLGLKSISHLDPPLPGLDVLIGAGVGVTRETDAAQGDNFVAGNRYMTTADLHAVSVENGGAYTIAIRTSGVPGSRHLENVAQQAIKDGRRLFGFYGVNNGHLPFQTADGQYDPTVGVRRTNAGQTVTATAEKYSNADIQENPTLSEMTSAALNVLASRSDRLWLMVESGDVDWANHSNNIDNSIGAVHSGDDAIRTIANWVEANGGWEDTALIVTADHGHYLTLTQPEGLVPTAE